MSASLNRPPRLTLGTAQLGMSYGIANVTGRPSLRDAERLLEGAKERGLSYVDTSPAYGVAETTLGRLVGADPSFRIVTKLPSLEATATEVSDGDLRALVARHVESSCSRLRRTAIDGYLIHDERDYRRFGRRIMTILSALRDEGRLARIGVSVYSPDVGQRASRDPLVDALQVPFNLLDPRFGDASRRARGRGAIVFARSIYLQGLFHLSSAEVARKLPRAVGPMEELMDVASRTGTSLAELAFRFAHHHSDVDSLVVGAESTAQVRDNADHLELPPLPAEVLDRIRDVAARCPVDVLNPSLWSAQRT